MIKKILSILLVVFLINYLIKVLTFLIYGEMELSILDSIYWGAIITLLFTGISASPGFAFATYRLLGDGYYRVKNEELVIKAFKILKIQWLQKLLLIFYWGFSWNRRRYFSGKRSGLIDFDIATRKSEFGHLLGFSLTVPAIVFLTYHKKFEIALWTTIINILINLYPVILQRFHRVRIQRALAKLEKPN